MPFSFDKKNLETSASGAPILRYRGDGRREIGTAEESTEDVQRKREEVYDRFFGTCETVYHEVFPQVPHIDVYTYPGTPGGRKWCTLVTGGMSDCAMRVPPEAGKSPRRVELIFYCTEPKPEYLEGLRWLASFPHAYQTWIGSGHTIPNGDPPAPMWGSRVLNSALFMPTIVKPDNTLPEKLSVAGDPVDFLWVVPLSQAECDLKLAQGYNAILGLFTQNRHSHIFNPDRASYV